MCYFWQPCTNRETSRNSFQINNVLPRRPIRSTTVRVTTLQALWNCLTYLYWFFAAILVLPVLCYQATTTVYYCHVVLRHVFFVHDTIAPRNVWKWLNKKYLSKSNIKLQQRTKQPRSPKLKVSNGHIGQFPRRDFPDSCQIPRRFQTSGRPVQWPQHDVAARPESQSLGTTAWALVCELANMIGDHQLWHRPSATTGNCMSPARIYHTAVYQTSAADWLLEKHGPTDFLLATGFRAKPQNFSVSVALRVQLS